MGFLKNIGSIIVTTGKSFAISQLQLPASLTPTTPTHRDGEKRWPAEHGCQRPRVARF